MTREQFEELLDQYITGTITAGAHAQLFELLEQPEYMRLLSARMQADWEDGRYETEREESLRSLIESKVNGQIDNLNYRIPRTVHRVHLLRTAWFRYAAAVVLFLSIGAYLWNYTTRPNKKTITATSHAQTNNDVNPGSNKATLVLGDESVINLDTATNGRLSTQGSSDIIKTADGEIIYTPASATPTAVTYQKLITPKGGEYQVTLSDGTQAWLNAASSIRFPSVFTGDKRQVEITGEVYFDVAKNAGQPFEVNTPKEKIIVLGTAFNINTYPDEPSTKTSLISGSVKIIPAGERQKEIILKPGEAYANGRITPTNTEQDISWKNGSFYFDDAHLDNILRQFARWYDIEIIYEGPPSDKKFFGMVSRSSTLSNVLKLLKANNISFVVDGKKLYVRSK